MKNNKKCLILIDSYERFFFYRRLFPALKQLGFDIHIVSAFLTIHAASKFYKVKSTLCKKGKQREVDVRNCLEFTVGAIPRNLAMAIYNSFYDAVQDVFSQQNINICIIWNGSRTQSRAVSAACKENGIPTVFLELSNIDKKLFADPYGTNTESWLYNNFSELKKLSRNTGVDFEDWKKKYIEKNIVSHNVKQAKKSKSIKFEYLLDFPLWNLGINQRLIPNSRLIGIFRDIFPSIGKINKSTILPLNKPYIFLPLQVNNDSQIRYHSDTGNVEAIKFAANDAASRNLDLFIKIHPAENDKYFLESIDDLQKTYGFHLSSNNTFELIQKCKKLIVINSSVALEAIIIGKEVTFLGRSIYKFLNAVNLENYIHGFLLDIDYFDKTEVSLETTNKLIKRGRLAQIE